MLAKTGSEGSRHVLAGYAVGPNSGGHFNPAVSVGLWAGGRFPAALLVPSMVSQVAGAVAGAGVLYLIASGKADFSLALTLIPLISIPVTTRSVNPARSTGPALSVGGWALRQLSLFWIAPLLGAAAAGRTYRALLEGPAEAPPVPGRPVAA